MAPPPRFPRTLLVIGGTALLLAGLAGVALGIAVPDRIRSLLPPVAIDVAAVGGATVALSLVAALCGIVQIGIGLLLARGRMVVAATGVTVIALIGTLLLALAVALLTEVAAGASAWLIPPGLALLGIAATYAAAAWRLAAGSARLPGGPGIGR